MSYRTTYSAWRAAGGLRDAERAELDALSGNEAELEDRFFAPLTFGTAGLRGLVGLGTRRMNVYTVRQATHGFGRVVLEDAPPGGPPEVCLCFDCRPSSREFAREAAAVLAGMGVRVRMFLEPRPTPQLSFAVRHLGAAGGINITASHNPKGYNGYKAYWRGGVQIGDAQAGRIAAHMADIDPLACAPAASFAAACQAGMITFLGSELDDAFVAACLACAIDRQAPARAGDLSIVYTPFHGVGGAIFPRLLAEAGFSNVFCVPEQIEPDGTFPTLESPNPEDPGGFELAIGHASRLGAHLILGADPDADRVAAVARDRRGAWTLITGNQMGGLLTDYLVAAHRRAGTLAANAALVQTIVTGGLSRAVAAEAGLETVETFTGFRFLAEAVEALAGQGRPYLLAFEEAIGYMYGGHVRDKDSVTVGLLIAEMAAWHHAQGRTLIDVLEGLWRRHGYFAERTVSVPLPGVQGMREMRKVMGCMRTLPPKQISGAAVVRAIDYRKGEAVHLDGRARAALPIRGMDVLGYTLDDQSTFIVRPSGTEPKIKVYVHTRADSAEAAERAAERYAAEIHETLRL